MKICHIFGAGDFFEPPVMPCTGDFVVAADGGYHHAHQYTTDVDLLIGDFDSLPYIPQNVNITTLPREKSDTDMAHAIEAGLSRGFRIFHIHGGMGGRMDHTMTNIQLISSLAEKNAQGFLFDQSRAVTVIKNGAAHFPAVSAGIISVLCLSDKSQGVTLQGLKYPLENAVLHRTRPIGVSNEFTGKAASVSVETGVLLIDYPKQIMEHPWELICVC
ncbi:MAG: thiamine diphosphokinase [Oscillospiraceae bacterium]|nr:thiamine diphosphokinase [Oscillospiraceae bacterium]